jgi:putative membrane protein
MYWYGPHTGWSWALGLGSILFWVLVAVAIAALVRVFMRGRMNPPYSGYAGGPAPYGPAGPAPRQEASPEQILAERFARGEINQDEFHERMAALRAETAHSHPGPAPEPG